LFLLLLIIAMPPSLSRAFFLCGLLLSAPLFAQSIKVDNAWVRGTVPAQTATGAFMEITSATGATLLGASSPVAKTVEVHEMRMEGSTMKMRPLDKLDLPAGTTVKFTPATLHLMLLDLKQPLQPGSAVPVTLEIQGKDGKRTKVEFKAQVRALGAG
jgi:periplasmic copper chaperone A